MTATTLPIYPSVGRQGQPQLQVPRGRAAVHTGQLPCPPTRQRRFIAVTHTWQVRDCIAAIERVRERQSEPPAAPLLVVLMR